MKIKLTPEQYEQLKQDSWIEIRINDVDGQWLYFAFNDQMAFQYGEINQRNLTGYPRGWSFDDKDLQKMIPQKPTDPSYYHNDPLCPNCRTYMIYKFECCPKCGQVLDWRESD